MGFALRGQLLAVHVRKSQNDKEYAVAEVLTSRGGRHDVQPVFVKLEEVAELTPAIGTEVELPVNIRAKGDRLSVSMP